jgi:ketopantoate reductase
MPSDCGQAAASPAIRRVVGEGNEAAATVTRAEGGPDRLGLGDTCLASVDSSGQKNLRWRPSMVQDRGAGRRLELDDLIGVLVPKGAQHGLPTSVIRVCSMLLQPDAMGAARPGAGVRCRSGQNQKGRADPP